MRNARIMKCGPTAGKGDPKSTAGRAVPDPEPLDQARQPPIDRYCDLVLTGGVTDGVVYPWAILELAREYRFKNIGGTSVGAMAAALTAAAEYSRRHGHLSGFNEVLMKLPRKLGENVTRKGKRKGRTRIFTLFQPAKPNQRLFDLFVGLFSTGGLSFGPTLISSTPSTAATTASTGTAKYFAIPRKIFDRISKVAKLLWPFLSSYRWAAGIGFAAGFLVGAGVFCHLLLSALFLFVFVMFAIYCDLVKGLVPNGFGICTGGHADGTPADEPSLVEWLYQGIQGAARKPLDQPLTFKDLWDAPGGPIERPIPAARRTRKPRSIDLRVITTNLTHGRPYGLPLDDETSRLFFKVEELRPYFPEPVIQHLKDHSKPYLPVWCEDPAEAPEDIRELPNSELPVVVAARLSLSFPVLFSAVPLWAIDYEPKREEREVRRCRFSDGGICSNFPIHLFDAAVPEWPTFGISLAPSGAFRQDRLVWLPELHFQGRGDCWNRFDDESSLSTGESVPPLDRLLGFIASIIFSAKDWDYQTSMRMPGVRDRVVHIFLDQSGGLNLKLTAERIMELASEYGQPAGTALVDKFIRRPGGKPPANAWDEHRWVRFNTFLVGLRERIEGIAAAADLPGYGKPLSKRIPEATSKRPLAGTDAAGAELSGLQEQDLKNLLAALKDLESAFAQSALPQPYKPEPPPSLHIRAPL